MICDSPFTSLNSLATEMVERGRAQGLWAPNVIVSVVIRMISGTVKKKAGFKVEGEVGQGVKDGAKRQQTHYTTFLHNL